MFGQNCTAVFGENEKLYDIFFVDNYPKPPGKLSPDWCDLW